MTRIQDHVPLAIFKIRALGFEALGQPIDFNFSAQYHRGATALHPSTAGPSPHSNLDQEFSSCLKHKTSVTISSLVSCYAWLLSPARPCISLFALTSLGLLMDLITSTFLYPLCRWIVSCWQGLCLCCALCPAPPGLCSSHALAVT